MARPAEKLADSLDELRKVQEGGLTAIRSADLSRTHRQRRVPMDYRSGGKTKRIHGRAGRGKREPKHQAFLEVSGIAGPSAARIGGQVKSAFVRAESNFREFVFHGAFEV